MSLLYLEVDYVMGKNRRATSCASIWNCLQVLPEKEKSTAKASQNLSLMRSRCEFCRKAGCRAAPGKGDMLLWRGRSTQRSAEVAASGIQSLRFDLLTHEKLFSAHCSQRSVTLLMDGDWTVQEQDCCGSARSEGQWGQGKRCWADRTIYRVESLSAGGSVPEKTHGTVADRKRICC